MVTVFIRVGDPVELRRRLAGRGTDDAEEIERRLRVSAEEMAHAGQYQHVIESGTRDADFARLDAIYRAARAPRP
jgi:guanylate kinase